MSTGHQSDEKTMVSRRNLLLAGTALAAAPALNTAAGLEPAQAQQQSQSAIQPGRKPNILVIMGDGLSSRHDVG
jgi:arylsulfatase